MNIINWKKKCKKKKKNKINKRKKSGVGSIIESYRSKDFFLHHKSAQLYYETVTGKNWKIIKFFSQNYGIWQS